jgi:hypothetical protein
MANPLSQADPWETSFETMTSQAQKTTAQVKKSAGDTVKAVLQDVKQQVSGDYGAAMEQGQQAGAAGQSPKISPQEQAAKLQDEEKKKRELIAQTRQNLERINMEIKRARDERLKKEEERKKAEQKKAEEKKVVEQKKKEEDPAWKKMLQGKMGSREMAKGVSG